MTCPSAFRLRAACSAFGFAGLLGSGACTGTPLPEPPDELPRPEFGDFAGTGVDVATYPPPPQTSVWIAAMQVPPQTRAWILNLDSPSVAPIELSELMDGHLMQRLPAAAGDRVRVLYRTARSHSAPLDMEVVAPETAPTSLELAPLGDTSLPCLRVSPAESLVLSGARGQIALVNQCGAALELTRAALRLDDQGLQLEPPPPTLPAGARVELTLRDTAADPGGAERLDVLLLDVAAADGRSGRYALDVFSDSE